MSSPKYKLALGVVALALGVSACSAAKATGAGSGGFLLVKVTHLATGLNGAITVRGPSGYDRTLRSTGTLRGLAPGRYRVTAANVHAHARTFHPVVSTSRVTVTRDHGSKVTVSYLDAVFDSTKVAPNASVLSVAGRAGGSQTVILSGRQGGLSTSLVPGDVLVLGATPASPDGLLGKITSVRESHGNLVVHVVRSSLYRAVPSGSINVSTTISSDDLHLNGTLTSFTASPPPLPKTNPFKKNLSCKTSDSASAEGHFAFKLDPKFHVAWGHFSVNSASFSISATEQTTVMATANGLAQCTLKTTGLLPTSIKLPTITVFIWFVPVVITPRLQFNLSADEKVKATITAGATQTVTAEAGLTYNGDSHQITPSHEFNSRFVDKLPTPSATAQLTTTLGPEVTFLIEGLVSPSVNIYGTLKFRADTTASPICTLTGGLQAGAAISIPVLNFSKEDRQIIEFSKELAHCSGSPATASATPTAPATTPATAPTVVKTFEPWAATGPAGLKVPAPGLVITNGGTAACDSGSADDPGSGLAVRCNPPGNGIPCFINDTGDPGSPLLCSSDPTSKQVIEITPAAPGVATSLLNHADPNQPAWFLILADGRQCAFQGYGTNTNVLSYNCGGSIGATVPDRSQQTWTVREGTNQVNPALSSTRIAVVTAYR